ncbi:MAG: hypothetical protein LDL37_01225 [Asticcacaulis sp.]|uniref:hypothetical protein n=1 Tax=Asticcacaulis sp. TaxID=1872648 RepID=UPI0025C4DE98|nr:hypothetical protein [Asticcacaulis sp.]MCA1934041.1 hypothetical protein [Asticcacaulis sp.]
MKRNAALGSGLLLCLASAAHAADLTPQQALLSLEGEWTGALEYRDYQSDKWFALPVSRTVKMLEDKTTVLETSRYDDGPKTGIVYIYGLSAFEPDGRTLASASFRKGKPASEDRETVSLAKGATAENWTLYFDSTATDDDRPARIRVTMTYKDNAYTTLKEIDFTDDATETWITRNRSHMKRVTP